MAATTYRTRVWSAPTCGSPTCLWSIWPAITLPNFRDDTAIARATVPAASTISYRTCPAAASTASTARSTSPRSSAVSVQCATVTGAFTSGWVSEPTSSGALSYQYAISPGSFSSGALSASATAKFSAGADVYALCTTSTDESSRLPARWVRLSTPT